VLHQPAGQGRGAVPDLILQADELVRVRGEVELLLARHTGQDAARLRADTDRDRVFTAADAVAYGLADRVLEREAAPPGR
ncbi:MAG TPA: ATP-dependent Clp protease proteolytic subunit, partial [Microbacterium sp.]|uniref:ClpP family protease n=1 Tax=Microbacterium sp. TaxID=51671 RepID=UPI002B4A8A87